MLSIKVGKEFALMNYQPKPIRNTEMIRDQENHISYEKWAELTAKDIFFYEDEKPKSFGRFYDMFGDEFDEEESSSKSKKYQRY